jgi:SHS2 domain-containing protein
VSYSIEEHTSEAKFTATGDSVEEALSECVRAFSEVVGGLGGDTRHSFTVESESHEALLFDFLDELIFLQDTEDVVVSHAESIEYRQTDRGHRVEATVWTDAVTSRMDVLDVKGPTYSEMEFSYEKGEGWKITAVLDI